MDEREQTLAAGSWLREQLDQREISVRQFAAALDVSTQVVYDWLRGKHRPGEKRFEAIAEQLGLQVADVRRGLGLWVDDLPAEPAGPIDHKLPADLRANPEFMYDWKRLPEDKQRQLWAGAMQDAKQKVRDDLLVAVKATHEETAR